MRKLKFFSIAAVTFVAGISLWLFFSFILPGQGPVVEEWQTQNSKFQVRVQRRPDLYGFGTYYYIFDSAPSGSNSWREVVRLLHDEPIPLPKNQIRFVNDEVGFLFMELKYAVTTDGGKTWSVFDFVKQYDPQRHDFSRIANVEVLRDGSGTVRMYGFEGTLKESPSFYTEDFGKRWSPK